MKYIIKGEGDNIYEHKYESMSGIYAFLYSILENIEQSSWDSSPMFDIEDDRIVVSTPEGIFQCNGWHWYDEGHKELLMPDGESFYSKCSKLYN